MTPEQIEAHGINHLSAIVWHLRQGEVNAGLSQDALANYLESVDKGLRTLQQRLEAAERFADASNSRAELAERRLETAERERVALQQRLAEAEGKLSTAMKVIDDWCEEERLVKQSAARVLDAKWLEGDNYAVPDTSVIVDELVKRLADYEKAAPLCEQHKPDGGSRSGCLICGLQKMNDAMSRIDYACGEANELKVSGYDVHCDEELVVKAVEGLKQRLAEADHNLCQALLDENAKLKQRLAEAERERGETLSRHRKGGSVERLA